MNLEEFGITNGTNALQSASLERNDKTIDYSSSKPLTYIDIVNLTKGLNVISEFFDVNAVVTVSGTNICAVALGKSVEEAITSAMDGDPICFIDAYIIASSEIDGDTAKMLKSSHVIAAPKFTKNALEYLDAHNICYVVLETPLKEYKNYLQNEILQTPLGTLTQTPNLNELNKDTFKVETLKKPNVEQIEDAVFAWKIAKHARSRAVVVAQDLKTSAISQGLQFDAVEFALNKSCEKSKNSILATDFALSIHDLNAAVQCRIGLIISPFVAADVIKAADKYDIAIISTGITNNLF